MGATQSTDISFVPKVWSDHTQAYVDEKLGISQLAFIDKTLEGKPGETVNFPYFKMIGDVQEPEEDEGLAVDKLLDDAFSVTIKEVGKAVGWTDKALRKSANKDLFVTEAQRQMAYKFSKKLDDDCLTVLLDADSSYIPGSETSSNEYNVLESGGVNTNVATVPSLIGLKIAGFGDHAEDAQAIIMHSQHFVNIVRDTNSGFLKADAVDPFYNRPGFMGRLLGMAVFINDRIPQVGTVNGKKVRPVFMTKANPFGIFMAQDMRPEMDRDILQRETLVAATMWYGVLSLHGKVSAEDKRVVRGNFATGEAA